MKIYYIYINASVCTVCARIVEVVYDTSSGATTRVAHGGSLIGETKTL
jgi:hypothetical protein